ncbi:interleukin-8 [Sphaeramia orbicularis]|uniref:interleukin-8 n=1 Tax=Sphaeramia orbicularis TaxID=375764 RepID=UPI00117BEDBD|nr:C-X-C motif chemokine 13 [Sphaeramia orbicularis]
MTTKVLLLLAAVTFCCCITSLEAMGCRCLRKTPGRLPNKAIKHIKNIEIIPISGSCRHTQIIFTMIRGNTICVDPAARWVSEVIATVQKRGETKEASGSTTDSPFTTNSINGVGGHSILK